MTRYTLSFLILLCFAYEAQAQVQDHFTIKSGSHVRDFLKPSDVYQYETFTPGVVQFKNKRTVSSKMNYNRFSGEMEFIRVTDTLNLVEKESIIQIKIADDVFYPGLDHDMGYLQLVAGTKSARLLRKSYFRLVNIQQASGLGTVSSTASINSYGGLIGNNGSVVTGGRMLDLVANEDLVYKRETNYYFGNDKEQFAHADKKNILKLFPEKKSFLTTYFKGHDVDFGNEESLKGLLAVISEN